MSELIKDDFVYGSVIRSNGTVVELQYERQGTTYRLASLAEGYVPTDGVLGCPTVFFASLCNAIRQNGLCLPGDFRRANDYLSQHKYPSFIKLSAEYGVTTPALDDAIITMMLAGKRFEAMIYTRLDQVGPAMWDNGGIAIVQGWFGFETKERAVATLLELPSDSELVRL